MKIKTLKTPIHAPKPVKHLRRPLLRIHAFASILIAGLGSLAGCATHSKPPPEISLDDVIAAHVLPDPPKPVAVVSVPKPLPLPDQLKPLPGTAADKPDAESPDDEASVARAKEEARAVRVNDESRVARANEESRVARANAEARVPPSLDDYVNAIQVWPYTEGALYQVYTSPGRVTVIALQPGEQLVTVSAGDTVRWIVGDTTSGAGEAQRVSVLVKPVRTGLKTNLVISTNRRTYLIELTSTPRTWMASVSWDYPKDDMLALQKQAQAAETALPVDSGLSIEQIRFRYAITGDSPPWRPLRAFDDGRHVYIQFPSGIAQGELPPLFVIGPRGDGQLVNYRYRAPYYVVDRLFGAAELRLGADKANVVRIERTDGIVHASALWPAGSNGGAK